MKLKKNRPFGFFVLETKGNINIKHEAETKKKQAPSKILKKNTKRWFFKQVWFRLCCTVNQVGKIAPGLIKKASNEMNNVAQQRINQIISQGGKEVERALPKILWGAIEDTYQTPFRLLRNFGKQQLNKLKNKILC